MNMSMNMEEWAVFASHWKSRKLLLMLLTKFCWTEVLSKNIWEVFWADPCLPRQNLVCIILESFVNFLDDPYYEPLPWFMIYVIYLWLQLLQILLIFIISLFQISICFNEYIQLVICLLYQESIIGYTIIINIAS